MISEIRTLPKRVCGTLEDDLERGFGALETDRGCLPLTSLDVRGSISGLWSRVSVTQVFHNTLSEPIEATYVFPLPERAAVRRCDFYVGERHIEGLLKERGAARDEYDRAIATGHRAAIAEEDRSGVFSLRVGNIAAGESIRVELEMLGPLEVADGEATFRFPLVVAPRYVPGLPLDGQQAGLGHTADTDQVPDASRITPPVLLAGFPNPVRLSLEVELDPADLESTAGSWRDGLACSLHSVVTDEGPPWKITLHPGERLDRDFLLRFPVCGSAVAAGLQVSDAVEDRLGTLAVTLIPEMVPASGQAPPRDVVILLDRSGSMGGWSMVAARRAAGRLVDSLSDQDRFAVLAFDHQIESFVEGLGPASDRNRWRAIEWLGQLEARGGTEMGPALQRAAGLLGGSETVREPIIVLITDGQVAGEDILLRQLQQAAGGRPPRVFAIGIDQAVNAGFLRRLADLGRGAFELVESEDRLDEVMDSFGRLVGTPVLTDVSLEAVGLTWEPESLVPARLPDLFEGRPVTIHARHSSADRPIRVRVRARTADGSPWVRELTAVAGDSETLLSGWGRQRVRELEDRYAAGGSSDPLRLQAEIVSVSLEAGVLSRFTAFVAVDHVEVVEGGGLPIEIIQPVEEPAGWEMAQMAQMAQLSEMVECSVECSVEEDVIGVMASPSMFVNAHRIADRQHALRPSAADQVDIEIRNDADELLLGLKGMISLGAPDDPANWVKSVLKHLKPLVKKLVAAKHDEADRFSEFLAESKAYLKWLRKPKGRPAPFASLEAWMQEAQAVVGLLVEAEQPLEREPFWL